MDEVHAELRLRDATLAVAESLTGGQLCAALTEPAGASKVIRGGLVVYATDLKAALAGVDNDLLQREGPVDPRVAHQLAMGARDRLAASYGVGVTGVAGPDEQDGHGVGEVHLAFVGPRSLAVLESLSLASVPSADPGVPVAGASRTRRHAIRLAAVDAAIDLVWRVLRESSGR